jgi:hypothetical protein
MIERKDKGKASYLTIDGDFPTTPDKMSVVPFFFFHRKIVFLFFFLGPLVTSTRLTTLSLQKKKNLSKGWAMGFFSSI